MTNTSWNEAVIATRAEAAAFLTEQAKGASRFASTVKYGQDIIDTPTQWGFVHYIENHQGRQPLMTLCLDLQDGQISVSQFSVAPALKRRGYGRKMLKTALGIVHEAGMAELRLPKADQDGPGFGASMGMLPIDMPYKLAGVLEQVIDQRSVELDTTSLSRLKIIQGLAKQNPIAGWRAISQDKTKKLDGYYIKDEVFRLGWRGTDLVLPLTNVGTQVILLGQVGALPDFSPKRPTNVVNIAEAQKPAA